MVANFKVLQSVFDRESISKYVDVSRLLNGKFQDNLEFLQWLKSFFDKNYGGQEYNALERREQARAQYKKGHKFAGGGSAAGPGAGGGSRISAPPPATRAAASSLSSKQPPAAAVASKPAAARPAVSRLAAGAGAPGAKSPAPAAKGAAGAARDGQVLELQAQVAELQQAMEGLEKERGFYFGKLREIEILMQDEAPQPELTVEAVRKQVLDILYQTDDAAEFQSPDDEQPQPDNSEHLASAASAAAAEQDANGDDGLVDAAGGGEGLLDDVELTETF